MYNEPHEKLKALAHPVRVEILKAVKESNSSSSKELYDLLGEGMSQSGFYQHISSLRQAGILDSSRRKNKVLLTVNIDAIRQAKELLNTL